MQGIHPKPVSGPGEGLPSDECSNIGPGKEAYGLVVDNPKNKTPLDRFKISSMFGYLFRIIEG
ncbi:MAG: hypothetical protein A2Y79_09235 [Deltaproteobacteria bacterium RBG_13_43_22]|nr:MAG: hypothetical protein A2Y79_09235 [Deltaproteobacteria bacterium RBG_13_43_22]